MSDLVDRAIVFATKAHEGQVRKMANTPYILHPMEVATIAATMTESPDVIAAALLHDTVEDCNVDPLEIKEKFGLRVFGLVQSETEDKMQHMSASASWLTRKQDSLLVLRNVTDRDVKILWLSDKLSNVRSFYRQYLRDGSAIWNYTNQKDPQMQYWLYSTIGELLEELKDYAAYQEYMLLISIIFEKEMKGDE